MMRCFSEAFKSTQLLLMLLLLHWLTNGVYGGQTCTDNVNVQQLGSDDNIPQRNVTIIPNLNFTCDGRITFIRVRVQLLNTSVSNNPYIQVWRPSSSASMVYDKIGEVQVQESQVSLYLIEGAERRVANITLTGNNSIPVQSGDVVGFYHPEDSLHEVKTIPTEGYVMYLFTGSATTRALDLNNATSSVDRRQPLIQFTFERQCSNLLTPSNGVITSCSSGSIGVGCEGDTCNLTCSTGYELTGSETRTCQSDGSWSGSDDVCRRVPCPSLNDPTNGTINCSLRDDGVLSYEDTCNFTCNTGYELTGSPQRTCQFDGRWSGSPVSCTIMECPSSSLPMNSTLAESCSSTYQSMCDLQCEEGFNGNGDPSYVCDVLSNGSVMWMTSGGGWSCEKTQTDVQPQTTTIQTLQMSPTATQSLLSATVLQPQTSSPTVESQTSSMVVQPQTSSAVVESQTSSMVVQPQTSSTEAEMSSTIMTSSIMIQTETTSSLLTFTLSLSPTPTPPDIIAIHATLNYVEDGAPILLLVDVNNAIIIQRATVELLGAGRMEFLSDASPVSSSITKNISDHLLVYTGDASVEDYLEILNKTTYVHMGQNFAAEQRTVIVMVTINGEDYSTSISINLIPDPDPPVFGFTGERSCDGSCAQYLYDTKIDGPLPVPYKQFTLTSHMLCLCDVDDNMITSATVTVSGPNGIGNVTFNRYGNIVVAEETDNDTAMFTITNITAGDFTDLLMTLNSFTYGYDSYTEGISTIGDVEVTFTVTDSTSLLSTATITLQPPDNINCHLRTSSCSDFSNCLDDALLCDNAGFPVSIHQDFFLTLCDSINSLSDPSVVNWKNEVTSCLYYELTTLSARHANNDPRSLECKLYEDDFMDMVESCIVSQQPIYEQFCSPGEDIALLQNFITPLNSIAYYRTTAVGLFEELAISCEFQNLQEIFYEAGNVLCLNVPVGASSNVFTKFGKLVEFGSVGYFDGPCNSFNPQSSPVGRRDVGNLVRRQVPSNDTVTQFVPNMTLTDGNSTCDIFMGIMTDNITILNCPACGDGNQSISEDCDDGNTNNTDGCSSNCTIEEGFVCDEPQGGLSVCTTCGNGVREGIETCDDNNTMEGDGCSVICRLEDGFMCNTSVDPTGCSFCGNGITELYEQCDDSNTMNNDGCSNCTINERYLCDTSVIPSLCTFCGDGVREGIEQCDDGNDDDIDGCDVSCSLVLQGDYECMENASNTTICMERPLILEINKTGEVPDVLILYRNEPQFFIDDLDITVRMSTLNNMTQDLDIMLVNGSGREIEEIDFVPLRAMMDGRIPMNTTFNIDMRSEQRIAISNLDGPVATYYALNSSIYRYFDLGPSLVSVRLITITLTQEDITNIINFTVQYRGDNLMPPELNYTAGDDVMYREGDNPVNIITGNLTITDQDHPTYLLQSATAKIIDYIEGDVLSVASPTSLMQSFTSGVLTIEGAGTIEEYSNAIRQITYNNTADEPVNSVRVITITVTDSPLTNGGSLTSNSINISINVVNTDDPPAPVLFDLYLSETSGPVGINFMTIDSSDPMDNYTNASLILLPESPDIESLSYSGTPPPHITVHNNSSPYSIIIEGTGSRDEYDTIIREVTYRWGSSNGNLPSGRLSLTVTDHMAPTTVTVNITVEDVVDDAPIFGFASSDVDRNSVAYPTTLDTSKLINYNSDEPVNFLTDIYLRDDSQLRSIMISFDSNVANVSDELLWDQTLLMSLGISNMTVKDSPTITRYTFSANLNETDWELFLMTFSFLCNEIRVVDRNLGNRTIIISADDGNNTSTVMIDINVLPLPPVINIDVPNIVFIEGDSYILLRDLDDPISVTQDQDSRFTSLTVTLSIPQSGYLLGLTEMINDFLPPSTLMVVDDTDPHLVQFSTSNRDGMTDQEVILALRSIIYINYEDEPIAFDNTTRSPLLRQIMISTVDGLSRTFQTNFTIEVQPLNDNAPYIRLFTIPSSCSYDSSSEMTMRKKRSVSSTPQTSKQVKKRDQTVSSNDQLMVPQISMVHGALTDDNCASHIMVQFSAPVTHPYVDVWPRLSLVLSLYPQYLTDLQPDAIWDGMDVLIIAFPKHNCSEWNYNESHITFKQSDDPCRSPLECITGVCYANHTGCRVAGDFTVNFTHDDIIMISCPYPSPTSSPLLPNGWAVNILIGLVVVLLGVVSFCVVWRCFGHRSHHERSNNNTQIKSDKIKHPRKSKKKQKRATIAQLASPPQHVDNMPTTQTQPYHHGDDDYVFLLVDDDHDTPNERSGVVEVDHSNQHDEEHEVSESKQPPSQELVTRALPSNDHTQHIDDITPPQTNNTPRRPIISDSVFTTLTADTS